MGAYRASAPSVLMLKDASAHADYDDDDDDGEGDLCAEVTAVADMLLSSSSSSSSSCLLPRTTPSGVLIPAVNR